MNCVCRECGGDRKTVVEFPQRDGVSDVRVVKCFTCHWREIDEEAERQRLATIAESSQRILESQPPSDPAEALARQVALEQDRRVIGGASGEPL